jgi:protease I
MTEGMLKGKRVLAIVSNYGVEQDELVIPAANLTRAGAIVTIAAIDDEPIQTLVGDRQPGKSIHPDTTLADVTAGDHDLLLIPGGTINADQLRQDIKAVALVRAFADTARPIAAICHGPWLLVEAGTLTAKVVTSYPSLRKDLEQSGIKQWVDESVVVNRRGTYPLITSRSPNDLNDFVDAIVAELADLAA